MRDQIPLESSRSGRNSGKVPALSKATSNLSRPELTGALPARTLPNPARAFAEALPSLAGTASSRPPELAGALLAQKLPCSRRRLQSCISCRRLAGVLPMPCRSLLAHLPTPCSHPPSLRFRSLSPLKIPQIFEGMPVLRSRRILGDLCPSDTHHKHMGCSKDNLRRSARVVHEANVRAPKTTC
jgi:hypothetical protein